MLFFIHLKCRVREEEAEYNLPKLLGNFLVIHKYTYFWQHMFIHMYVQSKVCI